MKVRELLSALRSAGGRPVRTKGSHQTWEVSGRRLVLVVNHPGSEATKGAVKSVRKFLAP